MVTASAPVVVGEVYVESDGGAARGARLAPIRGDDSLSKKVSTVDDLDLTEGRVAGVLATSDLGHDVVGHYGYGDGTDRPLPEWTPP